MPPVQSFRCPHCEQVVDRTKPPNFMSVGGPGPTDWNVIVLVCPHCQKSLGTYSSPQ